MEVLPVDVPAVVGITLGTMIFLIPIAGFTLRYAFKPFVEALLLAKGRNTSKEEIALLEKRIALLERELELRRFPPVSETPSVAGTVAPLRSYDRT